jgi:DNA polymerase-3 subunit beta
MEVELSIRMEHPAKEPGEATLPARKFLDICRSLPEQAEMEIEVSKDRAKIKSGHSRFSLTTMPAADFPTAEKSQPKLKFSLPQQILRGLLESTQFAMAQQDVRYYLNGLLFEISAGKLRAVATDGHRLALDEADVDIRTDAPHQIIMPRKGVHELARLLDGGDGAAKVEVGANHIRIDTGPLRFTSKLIDGRFPDYQRVIPAAGDKVMVADRQALRQGLTRASILSSEKFRGIRLSLSSGSLRALAHNPEQEEAEEELEVEYAGEDIEIGFNVSYLLDALAAIKTDKVRFCLSDPNSSCLILPEGEGPARYVVMPMRL